MNDQSEQFYALKIENDRLKAEVEEMIRARSTEAIDDELISLRARLAQAEKERDEARMLLTETAIHSGWNILQGQSSVPGFVKQLKSQRDAATQRIAELSHALTLEVADLDDELIFMPRRTTEEAIRSRLVRCRAAIAATKKD